MEQSVLTQDMLVTDGLTAQTMGSGTLPVLATPALVAFLENTAMKLVHDLPDGTTTVGTSMNLRHLRASAVGETIRCRAELMQHEGRKFTFALQATNEAGDIVGEGTHERFAVDVERFMGRLKQR